MTINLQKPIDSYNQADVAGWKANSCQHKNHGNKTSTRNTGCSNTSERSGQTEIQEDNHFFDNTFFTQNLNTSNTTRKIEMFNMVKFETSHCHCKVDD